MAEMLPYASAVVPTHNRASTLPIAVNSIQRQTLSNIEIIIVGDGASPEVVAVGEAIASADSRVRFLKCAKAPTDGGPNIDRGVGEARSERIFYCDDDDLWLPQHVETLGPHLDHSDLVDTLPVSVGTVPVSGTQRLHATLANSGNRRIRELLFKGRLKLTFDTHIAHRKSSYVSLGRPWAKGDGPSVDRVLATFAGNDRIRWTTLPTATALSLHGVARADAEASYRFTEIAEWSRRSEAWTPDRLMRDADFTWHFLRVLLADPPPVNVTLAQYFAGIGIDWNNTTPIRAGDSETTLSVHLEEPQRRAIETVFDLFQGRLVTKEDVAKVLPHLLDIVLGTIVSIKSGLRVLEPFGNAGAIEIVQRAQRDVPESGKLTSLLEAHLLTAAKRISEARAIAERLAGEPTLPAYDLTRLLTRIELAEGRPDAAAERMEAAWQEKPNVTAVGLELVGILIAANRKDRAISVCRELEQRLGPTHRGLASLYRRLGHVPASASPAPAMASGE